MRLGHRPARPAGGLDQGGDSRMGRSGPVKETGEVEQTVWRGGRERRGTLTGLLLACPFQAPRTLVLPAPFPDRHPGGKPCPTGLLSGPQGAVSQNLWEVGALAPNYLRPEAVACTLVSAPSLHSIPSHMFSPPGAKLLITIIPHVPLLTLHKISCCPSQKTG